MLDKKTHIIHLIIATILIGTINLTPLDTLKQYDSLVSYTYIFKFIETQTLKYLDLKINGVRPLSK